MENWNNCRYFWCVQGAWSVPVLSISRNWALAHPHLKCWRTSWYENPCWVYLCSTSELLAGRRVEQLFHRRVSLIDSSSQTSHPFNQSFESTNFLEPISSTHPDKNNRSKQHDSCWKTTIQKKRGQTFDGCRLVHSRSRRNIQAPVYRHHQSNATFTSKDGE